MRSASRLLPLWLLLPASAWAQVPVDARAASVASREEGKRLAAAGSSAEACAKYAESYSLDAQLEALLPLADCFEQSGKLASAYNAFRDAVEVAQRTADPRAASADARAQKLRPRLSYLTVEVLQDRRLPALAVERDGFRLGSSAWGVPVPIDPGQHVIAVSAYGYRSWQTTVDVQGEGAAPYVDVPLLEKLPAPEVAPAALPAPAAPPPAPAVTPAPAMSKRPTPAPDPHGNELPPTRMAAIAAAGAGVVSLGLGVYFLSKKNSTLTERDGICPSGKGCEPGTNARLAELTQDALGQQRAQIAFMAVGGAALALGGVLWFLPKRKQSDEVANYVLPVLQPSGGGFVFGGRL